jgi:hypothetical protein
MITTNIAPWAMEEMMTVDLGDERLDDRATILMSSLGNHPNLSIPAACGGRAEMKAAYRFFDNDKVTFEKVLAPHITATMKRLAEQEVVLLIQDTTEIDLTRPNQEVKGAGDLDGTRRGALLHEMHAFSQSGVPLGTVWAETLLRSEGVSHASPEEKRWKRHHMPIEEKESMRWLTALRQSQHVAEQLPGVCCVCVADSEADIYELFCESRGERGSIEWLIRAAHDRALRESPEADQGRYLLEAVMATPVLYEVTLKIRGREAKTNVEDRTRRQSRETRQAEVEVRAATVTLRPPWRHDRKLAPVQVNVVLVREEHSPKGEPSVEWILMTTLPISTPDEVRTIVEYYCVRWCIEILFRTLKSGCRIERRLFEDITRVLPALGLYLIVAWRTLFVCRMGRSCPDVDCEVIFEPSEWKAVWVAVNRKKPPRKAPRLGEMVHLIASLGGYFERKNSEPGPQTVWIGLQRMYDLAWGWEAFGPEASSGVS